MVVDIFSMVTSTANIIDLNPAYQRGVVWTDDQQSDFINSLFYNIIPSNVVFNIDSNKNYICLDGKQRITSIINFKQNKIFFQKSNDKMCIYYSKIPDDEDGSDCRKMTLDEKRKFDNVMVPYVSYEGLSYEEQVDVFNRIQKGTILSTGELITSMFVNDKISERFKIFCDSKQKYFEKFTKFNVNIKFHYVIIANIMYMANTKNLKYPKNKTREAFVQKTTFNLMTAYIKKVDALIDVCFGNDILGNVSIPKSLSVNLIYATCSIVNKYYIKSLDKISNDDKEVLLSTIRKLHRMIIGVTKDGTKVKREIFKTIEVMVDEFDKIRKDIIDGDPMSEEENIVDESEETSIGDE
jgi:hypothetical protein